MKKYEYMIMYKFQGGGGRCFININEEIKDTDGVIRVDEFLRSDKSDVDIPKEQKKGVFVSDFKLLNIKIK